MSGGAERQVIDLVLHLAACLSFLLAACAVTITVGRRTINLVAVGLLLWLVATMT